MRGNKYIIAGYHYDANHTVAVPIKNRKGPTTTTAAWKILRNTFKEAGVSPQMFVLDDDVSKDLAETFEDESITFQLVTPCKNSKQA